MAKKNFQTGPLDKLIEESIEEVNQINDELQEINPNNLSFDDAADAADADDEDEFLPAEDKTFVQKGDVIDRNSGDKISYAYVYKKIGDLIDIGNAQLQMLQSIDPDVTDPQMLTAATSLINAIRNCISEFTKIHQQWIRYQQLINLEKMKFNNKKELAKFRNDLKNKTDNSPAEAQQLIEIGSNELMDYLMWKKEKEEKEKDKK